MQGRQRILFFDGHCVLCDGFVVKMLLRDKRGILKFAPLQGETAKKLIPYQIQGSPAPDSQPATQPNIQPDTIVYLRDGQIFDRSTAVLLSLYDIGGLVRIFSIFLLVPRILRDPIYQLIARFRYRVFGKQDTCRIPTPEQKERLLN